MNTAELEDVSAEFENIVNAEGGKDEAVGTLNDILQPVKDVKISGKFRNARRSQAKKRKHWRQGRP